MGGGILHGRIQHGPRGGTGKARAATLLAILLLSTLTLAACGSESKPLPPPQSARAQAVRDTSRDGAALLTSTITVTFDRNFTVADQRVPLASNFELRVETITAGQIVEERVLVRSAAISETNSRVVILTVGRVVPDGAELRVRRSTFGRDLEGDLTVRVRSDIPNPLAALLASSALGISNPDVVTAGPSPEATEADRDPDVQRQALEAHVTNRGSPDEVIEQALAAYDAMPEEIVTSPKLRATLAALTGTFAEPAIDSLLTGNNCTGVPAVRVAFEEPPDYPDLFARVTHAPDGERIISVNPIIEGERIEHLMPVLAHEAIHCDRQGGRYEEIAATAFDSFLYLQLLGTFGDLALAGTPLAKDLNIDAIALINSGRALPESVGILPSPGISTALPGTNATFQSFAEMVAAAYPSITYNESPDEPLAQAYVAILANVVGMPEGSAFNLIYLDELLARAIDPLVYQQALYALELAPEP